MSAPFKMKGSPMQRNFKDWFKTTKLGKDLKAVGEDLTEKKKTLESKTQTAGDKLKGDLTNLKNRLFKRKKK